MTARGRSKDLVALVALLCAASYGTWLWMRSSLELGGGWTDGSQLWSSVRGERIRYAVWDEPVRLAGLEDEVASRPALSPDGRWLVFAVGERGLNADLYVAEMVAGVPSDVRPLWVLNGPRDELAPAFGHDALYFATDRTGTGDLDIWRAAYAAGTFAPPEPLARGVNTEADESDPWPLAEGGLVFASDRARGARRDWDLYRALPPDAGSAAPAATQGPPDAAPPGGPTAPAAFTVEPVDALNTPFDERDPSLSPDERTVVFASDRQGSQGGFDLYRSFLEDGAWLAPRPLNGVNDVDSERGPLLSRDGFSLFFDRTVGPDGAPELWRASSRELFHVPGPPVSWRELLVLIALVLMALTAWLAKRWSALEILYKCFLISLIAHFLLLWLLRDVYPEAEPTTLPGPERTFKVRLAPASQTTPLEARERSGELQAQHLEASSPSPERLAVQAPELAAAAPRAESSLDAPEAPRPSAPARPGAALEAPREVAVEARLENREAPLARLAESAPGLVVTARPTAERLPQETAGARPVRRAEAGPAPEPQSALQPVVSARLEGPDAPREGDALPAARRLSGDELGTPQAPAIEVAAPRESFAGEPLAGAPALALPEARELADGPGARTAQPVAGPGRREEAPLAWTPTGAQPAAVEGARLALPEGPRLEAPRRRESGQAVVAEPSLSAGLPSVAVRAPAAASPPAAPTDEGPRRFDPLAGLGPAPSASLPRPTPGDGTPAPRRLAERDGGAPEPLVAALPSAPLALAPPPEPAPEPAEDRPPRSQETPYKNRFGDEKLRALEEFGGSKETERAVAQGLAYLASIQNPRGYWGSRRDYHDKYGDVRIGKTALCLLAFLGAGHTPRSGAEHAAVSERAVDFLLSQLDPGSGHFGDSEAYGHGIASYALAECYALTKDPVLERPLRLAIEHILANQSDRPDPRFLGGWSYYYNDGRSWQGDRWPRVSVTSWQVMALESARLGGLDVPESAFDDARKFLLAAWDERREAFRYDHDPSRLRSGYPILPASTPAALFALSLLGVSSEGTELDAARRFVLARAPRDYSYSTEDDFVFQARGNLYFWYYATLAMFRTGGGSWRRWNSAMKDTLLPAQSSDGSWQPISIYARYAGDDEGDRSYSTAMCVLTLEVYYRYFTPLLAVR